MSRHQRRHRLEPLEHRRKVRLVCRHRGNGDDLPRLPLALPLPVAPVEVPQEDRARQIRERHHHADEAVGAGRVVGRPQLEHHLLLGAEVELLQMRALAQVPHVQLPAVLARQEQLGVEPVLHHVGRSPLARDHGVVAQVPEEVVRQVLRPAILLPAALHLERLVVEHEDAAGTVAARGAERVQVDPIGAAVHRVRGGVAGLRHDLLALDHLRQLRAAADRAWYRGCGCASECVPGTTR